MQSLITDYIQVNFNQSLNGSRNLGVLGDDRYARFKRATIPIDYAMKHGYCGILLNFSFAVSTVPSS